MAEIEIRAWIDKNLAGLAERRWDALMAQHRLVNAPLLHEVAERSGLLYAWTVNERAAIAGLQALGVHGIATADPRGILRLLPHLEILPRNRACRGRHEFAAALTRCRSGALVPSLCVGTRSATLCVSGSGSEAAERPRGRSHAERGSEGRSRAWVRGYEGSWQPPRAREPANPRTLRYIPPNRPHLRIRPIHLHLHRPVLLILL